MEHSSRAARVPWNPCTLPIRINEDVSLTYLPCAIFTSKIPTQTPGIVRTPGRICYSKQFGFKIWNLNIDYNEAFARHISDSERICFLTLQTKCYRFAHTSLCQPMKHKLLIFWIYVLSFYIYNMYNIWRINLRFFLFKTVVAM